MSTQRLQNNYPQNTRLRKDPSSLGARILSIQGDISSQISKDLYRSKFLYWPKLSFANVKKDIYEWDINNFSFNFENALVNGNATMPTIIADSNTIEVVTETEDLLHKPPTRLTLERTILSTDSILYRANINSLSSAIAEIKTPNRLWIQFTDIEYFSAAIDATKIRSQLNQTILRLIGEDLYGNEIIEEIFPNRNTIYRTFNVFSLLSEIQLQNISGTNGTIEIKSLDLDMIHYPIQSSPVYLKDQVKQAIVVTSVNTLDVNYFLFDVELQGLTNDDTDLYLPIYLLDSNEEIIDINAVSFVPDIEAPVILAANKLHFLPSNYLSINFNIPITDRTLECPIGLDLSYSYSKMDEKLTIFIFMRSISKRIQTVQIKVIDPSEEVFYLDDSLVLSSSEFTFIGEDADWPGDTLKDKSFSIYPDQIGQWEIIIEATDIESNTYTDAINFIVPSISPIRTITLNKSYQDLSIGEDGKIYLYDGTDLDIYKPIYDIGFIDSVNKKVYLLEDYSSIEVSYE